MVLLDQTGKAVTAFKKIDKTNDQDGSKSRAKSWHLQIRVSSYFDANSRDGNQQVCRRFPKWVVLFDQDAAVTGLQQVGQWLISRKQVKGKSCWCEWGLVSMPIRYGSKQMDSTWRWKLDWLLTAMVERSKLRKKLIEFSSINKP